MKRNNMVGLWIGIVAIAVFSFALVGRAQQPNNDIHLALVGDTNWHRRVSVNDDPAFLQLIQRIRSADARFANFEDLIHPLNIAAAPGGYSYAPPYITDEIKWVGFNLVSVANNHAFDYGQEGFLDSLHALDAAGIAYAGGGENLAFARAPAYIDTKHGRVALIASASTFREGSLAGEQRIDLRGRPGLDPLRFTTTYTVDKATFDGLQKLSALRGQGGGGNASSSVVNFGGAHYKAGETISIHTEPNEEDLAGIVASVRNARRQSDWVIVSIHAHEGAPGNRDLPAEFLVTFAHAAIDAGADVFVAHGPLILKGIEIYKGKPIFYSLGNFIFDGESGIPFFPAEDYDEYHLPYNALPADYRDKSLKNDGTKDTGSWPGDKLVWQSAVAEVSFSQDHKLKEIDLNPITLGFGEIRPHRGHPIPASPSDAQEIISRVAKLSAPFGTKVDFVGGRGVITLPQEQAQK